MTDPARHHVQKACSFLRMAADEFDVALYHNVAKAIRGFSKRYSDGIEDSAPAEKGRQSADIIIFPKPPSIRERST